MWSRTILLRAHTPATRSHQPPHTVQHQVQRRKPCNDPHDSVHCPNTGWPRRYLCRARASPCRSTWPASPRAARAPTTRRAALRCAPQLPLAKCTWPTPLFCVNRQFSLHILPQGAASSSSVSCLGWTADAALFAELFAEYCVFLVCFRHRTPCGHW